MSFSPGGAAAEGFRLIGTKPGAFVAWALFYIVTSAVFMAAIYLAMPGLFQLMSQSGTDAAANQAAIAAYFKDNLPQVIVGFLVLIPVLLIWSAIFTAAIYRAVLRPEDKGFAYLRLGADEFRLFGLTLLIVVVLIGVGIVLGVVFSLLAAVLIAQKLGWVLVLLGLALFGLYVWVVTRLSLCAAQTFAEKRITLFGSWKLTGGHFWGLFGMILILFAIVVGLALVNFAVRLAFLAAGARVTGMPDLSHVGPGLAITGAYYLFAALFSILQTVIVTAPAAAAYRDLAPRKDQSHVFG
jgi:hypothetical protein